jgi:hypothetical protein
MNELFLGLAPVFVGLMAALACALLLGLHQPGLSIPALAGIALLLWLGITRLLFWLRRDEP